MEQYLENAEYFAGTGCYELERQRQIDFRFVTESDWNAKYRLVFLNEST